MDRTSRVESGVADLRAAMEDESAKVVDLKGRLSDCFQKENQDLTNLEQNLAKLKEDMIVTMGITGKPFLLFVKKGKFQVQGGLARRKRTVELELEVPGGTFAHLIRECGGNVHDGHVNLTPGSFEKEIHQALSRTKRAPDLAAFSYFHSASRNSLMIFRTQGTIQYAAISTRAEFCQRTTQSVRVIQDIASIFTW
jgi:hypothetical protein